MAIARSLPLGTPLRARDTFRDIQHEVNRLFDRFLGRAPVDGGSSRAWTPSVDMFETPEHLILRFYLAGVGEKDTSLSIAGDVITVSGERRFDDDTPARSCLHMESAYGRFERTVRMPLPVQADRARATYRDGVLEVRLPKTDEARAKEIKIHSSSGKEVDTACWDVGATTPQFR